MPKTETDAERADRLQRACITLGKTITSMGDTMYAARIEDQQNGSVKAMEWIVNGMPGIWDNDPGTEWDGRESATDWVERTDAARDFNDDQPVRIVSRPGRPIDTVLGVMTPCPGRADVVCAVPGPDAICGASLADGPCRAHDDADTDR
jgi:hypothetical protein